MLTMPWKNPQSKLYPEQSLVLAVMLDDLMRRAEQY